MYAGVGAMFAGKGFLTSVGESVVLKVNSLCTLVIYINRHTSGSRGVSLLLSFERSLKKKTLKKRLTWL